MKEINRKGHPKVTDYYIELVAIANMIAHLNSDYICGKVKGSDQDRAAKDDAILRQLDPRTAKFHKEFAAINRDKPDSDKTKMVKLQKVEGFGFKYNRIIRAFNMAVTAIKKNGGLNYYRNNRPADAVYVIATEKCQVDAMGYLQEKLAPDKALLENKVEDTVFLLDHKSYTRTPCDKAFAKDVLSSWAVKRALAEESSGLILEHLKVYEGQLYILTSNSSGACLSSHDVVTPFGTDTDTFGECLVKVNVMTDSTNTFIPPRTIAKENCVDVIINYGDLPAYLRTHNRVPEGTSILIRRRQYPLVPSNIITTIRSAGLTILGPTINDNTRTMKPGDGHLMSSRKTTDDDMYFMHIPDSWAEMNAFDFKCQPAAKTLLDHLKKVSEENKCNSMIGNFYVTRGNKVEFGKRPSEKVQIRGREQW